jgi:hypothetical protein
MREPQLANTRWLPLAVMKMFGFERKIVRWG